MKPAKPTAILILITCLLLILACKKDGAGRSKYGDTSICHNHAQTLEVCFRC